ncbi:MAG: hypothetical protein GX466_08965 [Candidatus Cloacimonetes bacterium]|nr:hypothetical protein [Candidatus Cloacimonadota bacterium]
MSKTFLRWVAVWFSFVWTWVIFAFVLNETNPFAWNAMQRLAFLFLGSVWAGITHNHTRPEE